MDVTFEFERHHLFLDLTKLGHARKHRCVAHGHVRGQKENKQG